MLSPEVERERLEDILARVQENRKRMARPGVPAVKTASPEVPHVVKAATPATRLQAPMVFSPAPAKPKSAVAEFKASKRPERLTLGSLLRSTAALGGK